MLVEMARGLAPRRGAAIAGGVLQAKWVSDKIKLMGQGTAVSLRSRPESGAFVDDDVAQGQWRLGVDDDGHDVVAGWKRESQRPHRSLADR